LAFCNSNFSWADHCLPMGNLADSWASVGELGSLDPMRAQAPELVGERAKPERSLIGPAGNGA